MRTYCRGGERQRNVRSLYTTGPNVEEESEAAVNRPFPSNLESVSKGVFV